LYSTYFLLLHVTEYTTGMAHLKNTMLSNAPNITG